MVAALRFVATGARAQLHRPTRVTSSKLSVGTYSKNTRFSTASMHANQQKTPEQPKAAKANGPQEIETPSFDLASLGLGKNMRILVLAIVSVFGTIETWFWCKVIWRWWKGESTDKLEQPIE
ncbi:hypothetical protein S7711_10483 [Stachybotrys chartarum IBT 7711]|uniref:Uncharacterized protein n=1 Tax=Stachybotrys chartarum (strain CBS 109288 / IBT 7711) TaxID=1280523 RepID=A0A084BC60_STACB|nr:hypothetical protein S7711_10483 [Stachybotrys chartarum IBT 7711]